MRQYFVVMLLLVANLQAEMGSSKNVAWEEPEEIFSSPGHRGDYTYALMSSGTGSFWAIYGGHSQNGFALQAREFDGDRWRDISILAEGADYAQNMGASMWISNDDTVLVAYRNIRNGEYQLCFQEHHSNLGWSRQEVIASTPLFWQAKRIVSDQYGNRIAIFDQYDPEGGEAAVWSVIYDAKIGKWQEPKLVSDKSPAIVLTLLSNKRGDAVYLVYVDGSTRGDGVICHQWNDQLLSWEAPEVVPDSPGLVSLIGGAHSSSVPGCVDSKGDLTLFWENDSSPYNIYGSRRVAGSWERAVPLFSQLGTSTGYSSFGDADVSYSGEVMAIFSSKIDGDMHNLIAHYVPGEGWKRDQPTLYVGRNQRQFRTKICFADDRYACALLNNEATLLSFFYDIRERIWSGPIPFSKAILPYYPEIAYGEGEYFLVCDDEKEGANPYAISIASSPEFIADWKEEALDKELELELEELERSSRKKR